MRKILVLVFLVLMMFSLSPAFSLECRTVTLTDTEVQSLWDNFLYSGVRADSIYQGKSAKPIPKLEEGEKPKLEINNVDEKNSIGSSVAISNEKQDMSAKNPLLREDCTGDYSYALILEETLRVGRCTPEVENCSVDYAGLKFRNSEGYIDTVTTNLKNLVMEDESATDNDMSKKPIVTNEVKETVSEEGSLTDELMSTVNAKEVQRVEADMPLANHIKTYDFKGEFQSICTGESATQRCTVYNYSHFDKYFNSYFSGTIVATSFGPMVTGSVKMVYSGIKDRFGKGTFVQKGLNDLEESAGVFTKLKNAWRSRLSMDVSARNTRVQDRIAELKTLGIDFKDYQKGLDGKAPDDILKAFEDIKKKLNTSAKKSKFYDLAQEQRTAARDLKAILESGADLKTKAKLAKDYADGKDAVAKLKDNFFKDDDYKEYARYYINKDPSANTRDQWVTVDNEWKDFVTGEFSEVYKFKAIGHEPIQGSGVMTTGDELKNFLTNHPGESYVVTNTVKGDIPLNDGTIDTIKESVQGGFANISRVRDPTYVPVNTYNTDQVMEEWIKFMGKRTGNTETNTSAIINAMNNNKMVSKEYASLLNKFLYDPAFVGNQRIIYRLISNPLEIYGYWQLKTGGIFEGYKGYFIGKDEYSKISFDTGEERVYSDAYIDVFANAPVNNGDIFMRGISSVFGGFENLGIGLGTIRDTLGLNHRDEINDIILYSSTRNDCPACSVTYNYTDNGVRVASNLKAGSENYVLELPSFDNIDFAGVSLAVFAHHTDIYSKVNGAEGKVDIAKAITDNNTCLDRTKSLPLIGSIIEENPEKAGLILGIADTATGLTYLIPGVTGLSSMGFGLLLSVALYENFNTELEGCTDSEEGYFVQYIYNPPKEDNKQDSLNNLINRGKNLVTGKEEASKTSELQSKFNSAVESIKDNFSGFVKGSEKEFLQFKFTTEGDGSPHIMTNGILMSWNDGGAFCSKNEYDDETIQTICKGDQCFVINAPDETITNPQGEIIIKNPLVRLYSKNLRVGAGELPQSATFIPASLDQDYFKISLKTGLSVENNTSLMCIAEGVKLQSGKELNGNNLNAILGPIQRVHTKDYKIEEIGGAFEVVGGEIGRYSFSEELYVDGNKHVVLREEGIDFGEIEAIMMERGVIIYNNKMQEFIMWVRIIANMHATQLKELKGDLTTLKNPITNCDEYGVDLSVIPFDGDYEAELKSKEFNDALKKIGAAQYFETPTKTFYFYSKEEDGECKNYMKIVDKETGEVLVDSEISSINKTQDGFDVKTSDGQNHSFGFSAENGKPTLEHNGQKEDLLLAQGRGGSFYFDPKTEDMYVSNSQMIPLDDEFREKGMINNADVSTSGGNPQYATSSGSGNEGSIFDIPIFGIDERVLFSLISLIIAVGIIIKTRVD